MPTLSEFKAAESTATQPRPIRWVATILGVILLVQGTLRLVAAAVTEPRWTTALVGLTLLVPGVILLRYGRGALRMPFRPRVDRSADD